ncbi:MAG: hypothetical protein ACLP1Q_09745 [Solirubrobacteraceae bacterium]
MIFNRDPLDWEALARLIWDEEDVNRERDKYRQSVRQVVSRARKNLGEHSPVLPTGRRYRLTGRDPAHGRQLVRIDWDDFLRLQKANKHKQALSLVADGPLPELSENDERLGPLVARIRDEVREKVIESLEQLKRPIPDPLALSFHLAEFRTARPDDWEPLLAPTPSPPVLPRATRRPPPELGSFGAAELFETCHEGRARLGRELDEATLDQSETWWTGGLWLGKYFAFWFKTLTTPCEEIALAYRDDIYDARRFGEDDVDAPKEKATLIEAPKQLGDNPAKQVICGKTNWGLAHIWAKDHYGELLEHPSNLSVYGVRGRPVYPGILGVHTLVRTSDGFVLFALRSPQVDFHELTWSASFEESVSVDAREFTGPLTGDRTVLDPIHGGLYEEWGIEEDAIIDSTCLAIGREWVRERQEHGSWLNLSPTILTACRLKLSLQDVWASLDATGSIRDRDEHRAWAGCRFTDREDVLRFVAAARGRSGNIDLLQHLSREAAGRVEMQLYPGGAVDNIRDRGLMPTSAARLVLGSAWLSTLEQDE